MRRFLVIAFGLALVWPKIGSAKMLTTKTGIRYFVVEDHDFPFVQFRFLFLAGGYYDPKGKEGTAGLTARALVRGTKTRSYEQILDELDYLGSSLDTGALGLYSFVSGDVLSRNLDHFFGLVADIICNPVFPQKEVERERELMKADILHRRDSDPALVRYFFHRYLYQGSIVGRPVGGTLESLKHITIDDLKAFHQQHYTRKNLVVLVAGDITPKQVEGLLDRYFGDLPEGKDELYQVKDLPTHRGLNVLIVDKPNRTQTQIRIGNIAPGWNGPDPIAAYVADTAFGGTFTSLLTTEIRIKRGWSYGVGAYLDLYRERGTFSMGMFPKVEDTAPAIELSLKLLHEVVTKGLSDERIKRAKEHMVNHFPFELETSMKKVSAQASIFLRGKPSDLLETYTKRVQAVDPKRAREAFSHYADPKNGVIVVVGPADKLKDSLAKLPGVKDVKVIPYDSDLPQ